MSKMENILAGTNHRLDTDWRVTTEHVEQWAAGQLQAHNRAITAAPKGE